MSNNFYNLSKHKGGRSMKVLVGYFSSESNEHVHTHMDFDEYRYRYGEDICKLMQIDDIFENAGIDVIPTLLASGHPGGTVTKDAFDFISSRILQGVKNHIHEIDGIYLFLHGASKVIDLPGESGEHYIVREIRKLTGPYMPISVTMDPHGNLSQEMVNNCTIIRCYRQSPHTDKIETQRIVAKMLIDLLKKRRNIHPVYRKVPILLGGERCVSTDEPMISINKLLDKVEQDERIMSASYHIGYLRHDSEKCGASIIVVPNGEEDISYANEIADHILQFVIEQRHVFHYTGVYADPREALQRVIEYEGSPVFLTDSGDNCGAGATGYSTFVLQQLMELNEYHNKKIIVSGICDLHSDALLRSYKVGDTVEFDLGMDEDALSKAVHIKGMIKAKGHVWKEYKDDKNHKGEAVTITMDDKPIDVVVLGQSNSYTDNEQFVSSHLDMKNYDIFIVKQGYISPDFKEMSPFTIMSLTDGATNQRTENLSFKRILRPMFPYDEI